MSFDQLRALIASKNTPIVLRYLRYPLQIRSNTHIKLSPRLLVQTVRPTSWTVQRTARYIRKPSGTISLLS